MAGTDKPDFIVEASAKSAKRVVNQQPPQPDLNDAQPESAQPKSIQPESAQSESVQPESAQPEFDTQFEADLDAKPQKNLRGAPSQAKVCG